MTSTREDTAVHLLNNLHRLFLEQRHTDIQVFIKDAVFNCHKTVLAAMSPYFDAMFCSGMRESQDNVVHLQGLSAETFKILLNFLYSGSVSISTENAEDLLKASAMYQISPLTTQCETFLLRHVVTENCLAIWKIARAHGCKRLAENAYLCLIKNFQDISRTEDFLCLDADELVAVIADDDLTVTNEEIVCDAVFKWIKSEEETRKVHAEELFQHLRLPLVSSEYLVNEVESQNIVTDSRKCQDIVKEAVSFHMLPARRHEFISPRVAFRKNSSHEEILVVLGGYSQNREKVTDVICFSFRRNKWFILSPLIYKLGREYGSCVFGNDIFVSGGSQRPESLVRFCAEHNEWQKCTSMLQGRRRHAMVAVGESLFVLGGYNDNASEESRRTLSDIEEYKTGICMWRRVGSLLKAVRSMAFAA